MDADEEALPRRLEASVVSLETDSHLAGVGTRMEHYAVERFAWVKARQLALDPLADERPCTLWGAGPTA